MGGRECLFVVIDAPPRVEVSPSAWGGGGGLQLGGGCLSIVGFGLTLETVGRLGGGGLEAEGS